MGVKLILFPWSSVNFQTEVFFSWGGGEIFQLKMSASPPLPSTLTNSARNLGDVLPMTQKSTLQLYKQLLLLF